MLSDARLDDPLLNDAFDFSRYPVFKTRNAKLLTPHELGQRVCGRVTLFTYSGRASPPRAQHPRNVSEPQLVSSTNCMRESWFVNFGSARAVADIANLSNDDDIFATSRGTTITCERPADLSCDVDDEQSAKTSCTIEDIGDPTEQIEPSEYKAEEDSFYSMDSANQDVHPLLLSIPIIPQIKLERKATVRKPDSDVLSNADQNQSLLSPRIRDLRTPARVSSRRYGRILTRSSPLAVSADVTQTRSYGYRAFSFKKSRRSGPEPAYLRSASEPVLISTSSSDEESLLKKGIDESPHSEVLLSMIDEVGSHEPYSDLLESSNDPPKFSKRGHQRYSLSYSISFSSIVHAIADGCASLDHLLRKPKSKPKSTINPKPHDCVPDAQRLTIKRAPKQGQIVIKVFVPSTDDIWVFRVPQNINLVDFTSKVVGKLGFSVSFSGSLWDEPKYYFRTDERFKSWVQGRIRFGRNLPIVAHVLAQLPLGRLNVGGDGCEVWCYA